MPRYQPSHRAAVSAALTIPLAVGALAVGSSAVYAAGADESTQAAVDGRSVLPTAALLRPDGAQAVAPEYGNVRTMLPGAQAVPESLSPKPGLAVRSGMELEPRTTAPSRSTLRAAAGPEMGRVKVEDKRWARQEVNIRSGPGRRYDAVDTLGFREGIGFTGLRSGDWLQVKLDGESVWVNREVVSADRPPKPEPKPEPAPAPEPAAPAPAASSSSSSSSSSSQQSAPAPAPAAPSSAGCTNGSSVSGGANVLAVHRAVCATFPSITTYGTYRANSTNHASGRAIDVMVSGSTGYAVADYVRANAGSLGVSEVIYAQRIWTVERSGEGWRSMSDRGSSTANHYDHVHVSTY